MDIHEAVQVGLPLATGGAILGLSGLWRNKRQQEAQVTAAMQEAIDLELESERRKALLEGTTALRPQRETWRRTTGRGQIALLLVGSYAISEGVRILLEFFRAGAADHVAAIYVVEADLELQEQFHNDTPSVFHERVVYLRCPQYTVGFSAASPKVLWRHQEEWLQDVLDGARTWLSRLQAEDQPGQLLAIVSSGGTATVGQPAIAAFHERYPLVPIYIATILDHKTELRRRFAAIRKVYAHNDLIRGWIICDNRRESKRADLGLACLFAGMATATWIAGRPVALWNALPLIFPEDQPGRVATISVWAEQLTVRHLPQFLTLPEMYYTNGDQFEGKAMRGIRACLSNPLLQALPLETAGEGVTSVCLVAAPIIPPDLQGRSQRIEQRMARFLDADPDLSLQFASIGAPLTPTSRETPVVVVLLRAIKDDPTAVDALANGGEIDARYLPKRDEILRLLEEVSVNGHAPLAEVRP